MSKIILYQIFTRLFGNDNANCIQGGGIEENGCGKFEDFTPDALAAIKQLGVTHVWYTGLVEHATHSNPSFVLPPKRTRIFMRLVRKNARRLCSFAVKKSRRESWI